MTVANVVMFEFDTPGELKGWAQQYGKSGPFPNNIISLFVQTGDTSAIGINTYCLAPYIRPLIFGFSNKVSGAGGFMFRAW
jgi:hypothetical protein